MGESFSMNTATTALTLCWKSMMVLRKRFGVGLQKALYNAVSLIRVIPSSLTVIDSSEIRVFVVSPKPGLLSGDIFMIESDSCTNERSKSAMEGPKEFESNSGRF